MSDLNYTMGAIPGGSFRRELGRAHWDGTRWWAEVNGHLLECHWADPIQPAQGSPIVVDITSDGQGLSSAFVSHMYSTRPRPSTGTISVVGVSELAFIGADTGGYVTDRYLGTITDYHVGDSVRLNWAEGKAMVLQVLSSVVPPAPPPPPAPPTGPSSGYEVLAASVSDTFWGPGGWGSYATARNGGEDIYTGTYNGQTVTGAWFYGAPRPALQGKTPTKVLFRVPARIVAAGTRAAITVNFYAHTSQSRPGGDVNRVAGPHTVTIPAGYQPHMELDPNAPPGHISLPLDFAPHVQAGGGISIAGGPYAAFDSRLDDPESGKLIMDWNS